MSNIASFNPVRASDGDNDPVPGAKAYFYAPGTTTLRTVYADATLSTAHPSPLVADGDGIFAQVFSAQAIKVVVTTDEDATLYTLDPAVLVPASGSAASTITISPFSGVAGPDLQSALQQINSNISGAAASNGVGVTGNAPEIADIDATDIGTGWYRWIDTSTGTFPSDWSGEFGRLHMHRETAAAGHMDLYRRDTDDSCYRRNLISSTWGSWYPVAGDALTSEINDRTLEGLWQLITAATETIAAPTSGVTITGLGGYRDIKIITDRITANSGTSTRSVRVGTSGDGIITDSIYLTNDGLTSALNISSSSTASARSGQLDIIGFNTTWAVKPVSGGTMSVEGLTPRGIVSASAFDRVQVFTSSNSLTGGTIYVYGRK